MIEDSYRGYRRVVPSPEPIEIVEEDVIRHMLDCGVLVIACGGGGIPVVRENGLLRGIEAVIDKDRASQLLASRIPVDRLIITTDAEYVCLNFKKPGQRALTTVRAGELMQYYEAGQFPPQHGPQGPGGNALPRMRGKEVIITSDELLVEAVRGGAGPTCAPILIEEASDET